LDADLRMNAKDAILRVNIARFVCGHHGGLAAVSSARTQFTQSVTNEKASSVLASA
jgi:hypothetical protein